MAKKKQSQGDKAMLAITEIIRPRTKGDLRMLKDICSQLQHRIINETDEPLFELALEKAEGCIRAEKPIAMFFYLMKKPPFLYQSKRDKMIAHKYTEI